VKKEEELPIMPPKLDEDVALRLALMATELLEVSEWQGLAVQLSDFMLTQGQPAMLQATPQFRDLLVPTPASLPWTQLVRGKCRPLQRGHVIVDLRRHIYAPPTSSWDKWLAPVAMAPAPASNMVSVVVSVARTKGGRPDRRR
jgi:hypothetical protein